MYQEAVLFECPRTDISPRYDKNWQMENMISYLGTKYT